MITREKNAASLAGRCVPALLALALLAGCGGDDDNTPVAEREAASAVGSWFGRVVAIDPVTAAFDEFTLLLTLFGDGTVVANDSGEFTPTHGTGHGSWAGAHGSVDATYIWLNLSGTKPNGFLGVNKLRVNAQVDLNDPNLLLGTVSIQNFPEGTSPVVPAGVNGTPLGTYDLGGFSRIMVADAAAERSALPEGSWFGRARADNPATAPFPALVIEPTFHSDGNFIFNNSQEEATTHTAGHGQWTVDPSGLVRSTFLWLDVAGPDLAGVTRVTWQGTVGAGNSMLGSFETAFFPAGSDPLAPGAAGQLQETYILETLDRFEASQASAVSPQNRAAEPTVGSWFGRAIPDDPATVPFPEVYMSPTFLADGTFIANDAIPNSLHHTAHGHWVQTGDGTSETVFIFTLGNPMVPDGFGGAFRINFFATVDPVDPDLMTGFLQPVLFPPGTDPLGDITQPGVQPLGQLSFPELRRIKD